ncbi:ubiquitin-specific protease otu1 [Orbilia ellipsospora]|uniref:Ubiquitin thioesterase OTU n=1 Tax=Orbilia ellipsospora TaxID=2528407 RepID=A0AAV9XDF6_9PEZI
MRVRIRAPNGTHTLNLEDVATVGKLVDEIRAKTALSGGLALKYGFPPKSLNLPSRDTLLIDLPITIHGEQLIVSEDSSGYGASSHKTQPGPNSGPLSNSQGPLFEEEAREPYSSFVDAIPNAVKNFFSDSSPSPSKSDNPYAAIKGNEPVLRVEDNPGWSCTMRVMEDDNSCMFRAVNYVCARGIDMMSELRAIITSTIHDDGDLPPDLQRFSEVVLGMPRNKYCQKISNPNTWGGYIELTILSEYFDVTIHSISVDDASVVTYNPGKANYGILIYSGIHYDCVAASKNVNDPDQDVTIWSQHENNVLETAKKLCQILKDRNYATNTSKFDLKCGICGTKLKGERGAQRHAEETGHTDFTEYRESRN